MHRLGSFLFFFLSFICFRTILEWSKKAYNGSFDGSVWMVDFDIRQRTIFKLYNNYSSEHIK